MAKAVLISIQSKWCEKIASGEKTIEVRKTKPKLATPFKVYIYCTIGNGVKGDYLVPSGIQCGKVIGEFICDRIERYYYTELIGSNSYDEGYVLGEGETCLTAEQLMEYGKGDDLYGWHISDLKIYDKPKELSEFYKLCENDNNCVDCKYWVHEYNESGTTEFCGCDGLKPITRPPQSWCYVEDLGD